jgi:hypothetical protein
LYTDPCEAYFVSEQHAASKEAFTILPKETLSKFLAWTKIKLFLILYASQMIQALLRLPLSAVEGRTLPIS